MSVLAHVAGFLEPWRTLYGDSVALNSLVVFLHVGALIVAGGLAIATDRLTLRTGTDAESRARLLGELHALHRPVLAGLAVAFASGLLLLAADLEAFLAMPVLWIKFALIATLLLNGALMTRRERIARDPATGPEQLKRAWHRLRMHAVASLVLWLATTLAGTTLSVS